MVSPLWLQMGLFSIILCFTGKEITFADVSTARLFDHQWTFFTVPVIAVYAEQ
jgi:hypothetical protein